MWPLGLKLRDERILWLVSLGGLLGAPFLILTVMVFGPPSGPVEGIHRLGAMAWHWDSRIL